MANSTKRFDVQRLAHLKKAMARLKPLQAILFGSFARGEADEYSDLDVVIIQKTEKPFVQRLKEVALKCHLPFAVDFFVYTPQEFEAMKHAHHPFIQKVLQEGQMIYEK